MRYNIEFTVNYTEVAYSFYEYQTFQPELSCKACTLNDSFVGINRCAAPCGLPPALTACEAQTHTSGNPCLSAGHHVADVSQRAETGGTDCLAGACWHAS